MPPSFQTGVLYTKKFLPPKIEYLITVRLFDLHGRFQKVQPHISPAILVNIRGAPMPQLCMCGFRTSPAASLSRSTLRYVGQNVFSNGILP